MADKLIEKSGLITITMWPLEVDTQFVLSPAVVEPPISGAGVPGQVKVVPGKWDVRWTITEWSSKSGLDRLRAAQDAGTNITFPADSSNGNGAARFAVIDTLYEMPALTFS